MDEKKDVTKYREYTADRQVKLSKLIRELRTSSSLLKEFQSAPAAVATKYGLTLTEDETARVGEVATARISDEVGTDALEAVAGGVADSNGNCPCTPPPNGNCPCEGGGGTSASW
jgi:hypothetical protein